MLSSNVTYYAQWTPNKYALDVNNLVDGEDIGNVLSENIGSFKVYINGVDWWGDIGDYWDEEDYGTPYEVKDIKAMTGYKYVGPSNISGTFDATDNVVWLEWEAIPYTLTFDGNGGTPSEASRSVKYNKTYGTLPSATRVGYTLAGWNTKADGSGTNVTAETKMGASNVTLYAQWKANTLTINYYPNGATKYDHSESADGTGPFQTIEPELKFLTEVYKYGKTLPDTGLKNADRFIRTGYTCTNKYHVGSKDSSILLDSDSNIYSMVNELAEAAGVLEELEKGNVTINIYPEWKLGEYNLSLHNGVDVTDQRGIAFEDYTWGWHHFDKIDSKFVTDSSSKDNKTLVLTMSGKSTGDLPGPFIHKDDVGSLEVGKTYTYSVYIKGTAGKEMDYLGHEQGGIVGRETNTESVILTGDWQKITHTFTAIENVSQSFCFFTNDGWTEGETLEIKDFELYEGKQITRSDDTMGRMVTYGSSIGELPTLTRPGYTFLGWYTEMNGKGEKVESGDIFELKEDEVLYGHWKANTLTIDFYPNGATKYDDGSYGDGADIKTIKEPESKYRTDSYKYGNDIPETGLINADRYIRQGYSSTNRYYVGSKDSKILLDDSSGVYATTQDLAQAAGVLEALEQGDVTIYLYPEWKANSYTNDIGHWALGFKNGEGREDSTNKEAFLLKTDYFAEDYNNTFILDESLAITPPNGYYLKDDFGSNSIEGANGVWKRYEFGTTVAQIEGTMNFEYDYRPYDYNITYNLDGGTNSSNNPSTYNVLYGVTLEEPTKKGYTFEGWYENLLKSYTTATYEGNSWSQDGTEFTFTNTVEDNEFTYFKIQLFDELMTTYYKDITHSSETGIYSQEYTHTNATGNYTIVFGASSILYDCKVATNTVYLEQGKTYTVSYEVKSISKDEIVVDNVQFLSAEPVTGINEGCNATFANSEELYSELAKRSTGDIALTAKWKVKSYVNSILHYVVGFKNGEGNDGTHFRIGGTSFNQDYNSTYTVDSSKAVEIPNGLHLWEVFGSEDISEDGSWQYYDIGTTVTQKDENMGFQFNYMVNVYNIEYNLDGGTNSSSNPSTYNVLYGVTLENPTKKGYTFEGWYDNNGNKVTGINEGCNATFKSVDELYEQLESRTTGDISLTAKWTPNTYTIKYDANGGVGTMEDTVITFGVPTATRENAFTKEGYSFVGWHIYYKDNWQYHNKDCTDYSWYKKGEEPEGYELTLRENGTKVSTLIYNDGDVVTFVAQWEPIANYVYIDGIKGVDTNDGLTPETSVKTFKQAYSNLKELGGTIYVVNTVSISGNMVLDDSYYTDSTGTINLVNGKDLTIKRYSRPDAYTRLDGFNVSSNTGQLIYVESDGNLTLETITIDGHRNAVTTGDIRVIASGVQALSNAPLIYVDGTDEVDGVLTISDANLQNNNVTYHGSCIVVAGKATMNGGNITNNTGLHSGAISIIDGEFTMKGGTVSDNSISGTGTGDGGAAVRVSYNGIFNLEGGNITDNVAGRGGAIWLGDNNENSIMNMSGGTISNNTSANGGGAIYIDMDKLYTLNLTGGTITGNKAAKGGAIHSYGTVNITGKDVLISNNEATGNGGAICINRETLTITDGTISGNKSGNYGGGIYIHPNTTTTPTNISGGYIVNNTSTYSGGGIYLNKAKLEITGGEITGNSVLNEVNTVGAYQGGGGICVSSDGIVNLSGGLVSGNNSYRGAGVYVGGKLNVSGGSISNNEAQKGGGGIYLNETEESNMTLSDTATISNNKASKGAGIYSYGTLNMTGGTISNNEASDSGGGIYNKNSLTITGGNISGNTVEYYGGGINNEGTLSISGATISNNTGTTGGGIYLNIDNNYNITDTEFVGNKTKGQGAGGAINMQYGNLTLSDCTLSENEAYSGGAIRVSVDSVLNVEDGIISNNTAKYNGGAMINHGTINIKGGTISENKANNSGAIRNVATLNISGGTISNNEVTSKGGAINNTGTLTITGGTISNNKASGDGKGIYQNGIMNLSGNGKVSTSNDVYLNTDKFITITGELNYSDTAALITPSDYTLGRTVVRTAYGDALASDVYKQFELTSNGNSVLRPGDYVDDSARILDTNVIISGQYTIHFDKNLDDEVQNMPADQTAYWYEKVTISNKIPTSADYEFIDWNESQDGTGISWFDKIGTEIVFNRDSNLTLYAQWRLKFTLSADVYKMLMPDGEAETIIFKRGEQGKLEMITTGYATRIEVEFPTLSQYDSTLNQTHTLEPVYESVTEQYFNIPLYAPNGIYEIKVTAYNDNNTNKDPITVTLKIKVIDGSVLNDYLTILK